MRFNTPRFGHVEVDEAKIIHFPRGLPGFPECGRFIVMDHDRETPLKWLQCVDQPEVAFLVIEPEQVLASYQVDVPTDVLDLLEWNRDSENLPELALFVILNVEGSKLTANLRAPVVVNVANHRAHQHAGLQSLVAVVVRRCLLFPVHGP